MGGRERLRWRLLYGCKHSLSIAGVWLRHCTVGLMALNALQAIGGAVWHGIKGFRFVLDSHLLTTMSIH